MTMAELSTQNRDIIKRLSEIQHTLHERASCSSQSSMKLLTLHHVHALRYIHEHPGATMSELAQIFHITKASAHALVKRLCDRKLIVKRPDTTDRRITRLTPSALLSKHIETITNEKERAIDTLLKPLSAAEKSTLLTMLSKLTNSRKA